MDPLDPDKDTLSQGAEILKNGGLVAFPTETVYGLGANMLNESAVEKLKQVKNRPHGKHFTVHISDLNVITDLGLSISRRAGKLIEKFWPGPLTLILGAPDGSTVGFRMPKNRVALILLSLANVPVIAPSANISGESAPTEAPLVIKSFDGKIDAIIDSGPTDVGVESTVVDISAGDLSILREGAIKRDALLEALNE